MRTERGPRGQFSSLFGTSTLRLPADFPYPPGGPRYERLVFDVEGQLVVPLNEWYRPMQGVGAARTRDTYLAVLRPWFGFLAKHGYAWNARPEAVREYTRLFLLEAGCAMHSGSVEGWFVQATNKSPISTNGLHLLIAALRSFYTVMRRGAFDPQDQRFHPLYAFDNPMYSKVLVAWRSEHRKWMRNAGAPDHAGIRSQSRAAEAQQPVGFFQVKRQPLEPPVARDSEPTRLAILAGVRYMTDHAPPREAVILRILLESGARVSEVLGLTGVLFGTAVVTLMLTADARIHEILQISADRFVKPVRVYVVKNPDGTPKCDPTTNIVTDVIVEQRLLPKGRKRDDLRLQYDVSAARVHLHEIAHLLEAVHDGHIPSVPYD